MAELDARYGGQWAPEGGFAVDVYKRQLEYIEAVIQSYESGGEMVRPHPLPAIHGTPEYIH